LTNLTRRNGDRGVETTPATSSHRPLGREPMHPDYGPRETLRERLVRDLRAINTLLDNPHDDDLVLERLPNGSHAWMRPEERRYTITQRGRDDLHRAEAEQALFGRPWTTVAEAFELE
jgi:hypothetical protein